MTGEYVYIARAFKKPRVKQVRVAPLATANTRYPCEQRGLLLRNLQQNIYVLGTRGVVYYATRGG